MFKQLILFFSKKGRKRKAGGGDLNGEGGTTARGKQRRNNQSDNLQQLLPAGACKYELSSRGSKKLIDPQGFSYNVKAVNSNVNVTYWQCSIRPRVSSLVVGRSTYILVVFIVREAGARSGELSSLLMHGKLST